MSCLVADRSALAAVQVQLMVTLSLPLVVSAMLESSATVAVLLGQLPEAGAVTGMSKVTEPPLASAPVLVQVTVRLLSVQPVGMAPMTQPAPMVSLTDARPVATAFGPLLVMPTR